MSEQPLISIVTPSFNQASFLEATILSVLEQDYPNVEYIIIDGGSQDGSREIIQKYAHKLAYWVSEPDKGQTDAVNKGFARANGQILAWLNSDDLYYPQAVSEAVAYLQAHPQTGMVYGQADYIDSHGQVIGRFPAAQTDYRRLRRGYVHIPQQAAFWRAELWNQVGPLDTSYYFAMDYDLWLRFSQRSELHHHPRLWAGFRLHGESKTISEDDRCWPEMVRIHRRDGGSWFSILILKYYLRRLLAPLVTWRRRRRITSLETGETP
ncbi:MAG: glycosyltransferase [Anaerolineae bacterium]|nr:glycosyltransferase [Anaerolineae bacterium]